MALATQCPHCHTTFRVASDQLKLRGGIVRCGTCQRIFDGNAHLIDLDALAAAKKASEAAAAAPAAEAPTQPAPVEQSAPVEAPAAVDEPAPAAAEPAPESEPAAAANDFDAQPVYTLDFDHTFDPFGILPKSEPTLDAPDDLPPAPEVQAAEPDTPQERIEPGFGPLPEQDQAGEAHTGDAALPEAAEAAVAEAEPAAEPEAPAPEPEPEPQPDPEPIPEPATPAHAYAPEGRIEPSFDLPVDEELVALPMRGHEFEHEPEPEREPEAQASAPIEPVTPFQADAASIPPAALPLRASADPDPLFAPAREDAAAAPKSARAKAVEARTRRSKLTPTRIEAPKLRVPAEADEPEFVKRSRRQEESGRTVRILMAAGIVILLLALAAQLLLNFRDTLAARYPAARPALSAACRLLGCSVGWPAQAENLVIDDGDLAPIGADTYSLNTVLHNQGSLTLAWPSIELELTDANRKPLLRRVFGPSDYLPPGGAAAAGFGAHSEQPVRLNFALSDLKPSDYHIFVFYP